MTFMQVSSGRSQEEDAVGSNASRVAQVQVSATCTQVQQETQAQYHSEMICTVAIYGLLH